MSINYSNYNPQPVTDKKNSPLKQGAVVATGMSAFTGALVLGDKYCSKATEKFFYYASFSRPPKDLVGKSMLAGVSTKNKALLVLGMGLACGTCATISSFFQKPKKSQ